MINFIRKKLWNWLRRDQHSEPNTLIKETVGALLELNGIIVEQFKRENNISCASA